MDTHFGEAEAQRRAEERVQWQKAKRAKNLEKAKSRIFGSLKRGVSLLALMTFVAFAFTHQQEIQKFISTQMKHLGATNSGALRQNALNHENEVNQITQ